MTFVATRLPQVRTYTPVRYSDSRGWFSESFSAAALAAANLPFDWVQDNHSYSAHRGTVRGLHYQSPPYAQDKLVRCTRGAILDVAVDFRDGSPTFGQWVSVELTAEVGNQLFVPKGFLHGFATLQDDTEVQYKCTAPYSRDHDGGVRWDDPTIGIDWQLNGCEPILSDKDRGAPTLVKAPRPFRWEQPT